MILTNSQLEVLATWANALIASNPSYDENILAALANQIESPDYWVWRTSVPKHEITDKPSKHTDGTDTAFAWGGSAGGFVNRSEGERAAWHELFNSTLSCNPSLANVRTAFADIFSGSGAGAVGNRNHIWGTNQRKCTVGEKLFVVQTVGGPTQTGNRGTKTNPDTLVAEGDVTPQNIIDAIT